MRLTWNYTKTVAILLFSGAIIQVMVSEGDIWRAGGPLSATAAAFFIVIPGAVIADLIAWARRRRGHGRLQG